jgi:hypothetical protein
MMKAVVRDQKVNVIFMRRTGFYDQNFHLSIADDMVAVQVFFYIAVELCFMYFYSIIIWTEGEERTVALCSCTKIKPK